MYWLAKNSLLALHQPGVQDGRTWSGPSWPTNTHPFGLYQSIQTEIIVTLGDSWRADLELAFPIADQVWNIY